MSKIYQALELAKRTDQQRAPGTPTIPPFVTRTAAMKDLVVLSHPHSAIAESFRFLRSMIMCSSEFVPRTILVTSALKGDGKTFVACNLAASISQSMEEHVLLIDTDLRDPSAHSVFGLGSLDAGLSAYLANDKPLNTVLKKTGIEKLTLLPAGKSTKTPSELVASEKMKELIAEAKDRYPDRFIVIDSPPVELAPESSVLATVVDAVIMVIRHGKTPRNAAKVALEKIPKKNLLGVIFNCHNEPLKVYNRYRYYESGYTGTRT